MADEQDDVAKSIAMAKANAAKAKPLVATGESQHGDDVAKSIQMARENAGMETSGGGPGDSGTAMMREEFRIKKYASQEDKDNGAEPFEISEIAPVDTVIDRATGQVLSRQQREERSSDTDPPPDPAGELSHAPHERGP